MLEVFNAAWHVQWIAHAHRQLIPFSFKQSLDMHLGSMQCLKECDSEIVGCVEVLESESSLIVFLLLVRKSAVGKGGHAWKGMDMCRVLWKDGRKASLSLYILLSLP